MKHQRIDGYAVISPLDSQLDAITVGRWFNSDLIPTEPAILDLRAVLSLDVSGLSLLVNHALNDDCSCALLIEAGGWVEAMFQTVKLGELLPIYYSIEDAIGHMQEHFPKQGNALEEVVRQGESYVGNHAK